MAGIVTVAVGRDATYPFKQIGHREPGAAYYSAPAERGGEPEGIWTGAGCPDLGLPAGGTIDERLFVPLYDQHTDIRTGERLGRRMQSFRESVSARFSRLVRAEIGAVPGEGPVTAAEMARLPGGADGQRAADLAKRARREARRAAGYFDVTFSVSKSITLLHASAMAASAAAALAGDLEAAAYWQAAANDVWAAVLEGNTAGLEHLQEHAGITRSGYNGVRMEDAHQWVIGSFAQHTSRAGDPQLHVHNLVLNKVRRERDGAWRTIHGQMIFREAQAASAVATAVAEAALSRLFGVEWAERADGRGREIAGVPQALMDLFSTRTRQEIDGALLTLAAEYERKYGRSPDDFALEHLKQLAGQVTRRGKEEGPLDLAAAVTGWARRAAETDGAALAPLMAQVSARKGPGRERAQARAAAPDGASAQPGAGAPQVLAEDTAQQVMRGAVARLDCQQATWNRAQLIRALGSALPRGVGAMTRAGAAWMLPRLAERVLAGDSGAVAPVGPPDMLPPPARWQRSSGASMFTAPGGEVYASAATIASEHRVVRLAQQAGLHIPRVSREEAELALGAAADVLDAQLARHVPADVKTVSECGLRMDQAAAAWHLLTSDRRAAVLAGPAGTGKTRTLAEIARVWRSAFPRGQVVGLAVANAAVRVLSAEADLLPGDAANVALFLTALHRQELPPDSLIIIDEASMLGTREMARLLAIAAARSAKVILAGDHEQLPAPGAGGVLALLAGRLGWVQLGEPTRFREEWERDASLRLRAGDASAAEDYHRQGRLLHGTREEMTEKAYRRALADYMQGRQTVLIAHANADAAELARRFRGDLIFFGRVDGAGPATVLAGGARASAGDRIMAPAERQRADRWGARPVPDQP